MKTIFESCIPNDVLHIVNTLSDFGYEAYIVGGCVRDLFLNRTPNDWDICTSAKPEDVITVFSDYNIIPTGIKHGTVTIVLNSVNYEITTYRIDGKYSDSRRPDEVVFTSDIIEDLSRRDFTINAMAYNPSVGLIDPYNGRDDIEFKTIRCVRNAKDRFEEDALRILRAIRFACQLNFKIDPEIGWLLSNTNIWENLRNISQERITSEFVKMVTCRSFHKRFVWHIGIFTMLIPEFRPCINFQQNHPVHKYDVLLHTLKALEMSETDDLIVQLAILFHDIGKPHCLEVDKYGIGHFYGHGAKSAEITDSILRRMKFDNRTRESVVQLIKYHDAQFEVSEKHIKRWLNRMSREQFEKLLFLRRADVMGQNLGYLDERLNKTDNIFKIVEKIIVEQQCFSLKDLAINGKDLIKLGVKTGPPIGIILNLLLNEVISENVQNEKSQLVSFVELLIKNKCIRIEKEG